MTNLYTKQGRRYIPTTLAQQEAWGWHNLMVVAAFRYCLGRMTYISGVCADWIIANWKNFPPNAQQLIQRGLEESFQRDDDARANNYPIKELGWDCDRKEWEKIRALWASSPPFEPQEPTVAEIQHRAKWLAREMEAVGEAMLRSDPSQWGADPRGIGEDLDALSYRLLTCIHTPKGQDLGPAQ